MKPFVRTKQIIVSDRIKSLINKAMTDYNYRMNTLLSYKTNWLFIGFGVIAVVLIASFFVEPIIQFNITIGVVMSGVVITWLITIVGILLNHFLTRKDRKLQRDKAILDIEYIKKEIKKDKEKTK